MHRELNWTELLHGLLGHLWLLSTSEPWYGNQSSYILLSVIWFNAAEVAKIVNESKINNSPHLARKYARIGLGPDRFSDRNNNRGGGAKILDVSVFICSVIDNTTLFKLLCDCSFKTRKNLFGGTYINIAKFKDYVNNGSRHVAIYYCWARTQQRLLSLSCHRLQSKYFENLKEIWLPESVVRWFVCSIE